MSTRARQVHRVLDDTQPSPRGAFPWIADHLKSQRIWLGKGRCQPRRRTLVAVTKNESEVTCKRCQVWPNGARS